MNASEQDKRFLKSPSAETDWRDDEETANQMFEVFPIMQQLHEMLWYLTEALTLKVTLSIHSDLRYAFDKIERLTLLSPNSILELDLSAHNGLVNALLLHTSELVRSKHKSSKRLKKTYGRGARPHRC